jgi:hypothetical protein
MTPSGNILIDFTKWVFKWLAILLVGLLAVVFALIGGWWTWNWWSYERHEKQIEVVAINSAAPLSSPKLADRDGKSPEAMCAGSEFPIFVGFVNNSSRTVESLAIEMTARLPERSTNILTYGSRVEMDRIIKPGAGFGSCWKFSVRDEYRTDPQVSKAIYSGKIAYVRFKDD